MKRLFILLTSLLVLLLAATTIACSQTTNSGSTKTVTSTVTSTVAGSGTTQPAKTIELKFATIESDTHWRTPFMNWYAQELDKRTGGRTKTTVFTSGALGGSTELPDNITKGIVDMGFIVSSAIEGLAPLDAFFFIPTFMPDPATRSYVALDMIAKGYYKINGARIMLAHGTEPSVIFTANKKITKLEDFKGMKISGVPTSSQITDALGASLVPLPPPELYNAFERGLVDGGLMGTGLAQSLNLQEVAHYLLWEQMGSGLHVMMINENKFNSMPADIQAIMLNLNEEANFELTRLTYEQGTLAQDFWSQQKGFEVYTMAPAEWERTAALFKNWPTEKADELAAKGQPAHEALDLIMNDLGALGH